jgi:catechol-2,3-dioxygenase
MSDSASTTRREFVQTAAAALAMSAIPFGRPAAGGEPDASPAPRGIARIDLETGKLPELKRFYREQMEFPIVEESAEAFVARAGTTLLAFRAVEGSRAFHHFAFNIPENMLPQGKEWARKRSPLIRRPNGDEEYFFPSWNAHSVYFLDPAGNILEFIARHNLKNAKVGEFTSADILGASEIAIVVDDVAATAERAREEIGLQPFGGPPSSEFAALGDDHRLLIVARRNRPWNNGTVATVFPTRATFLGEKRGRLADAPHVFEIEQRAS